MSIECPLFDICVTNSHNMSIMHRLLNPINRGERLSLHKFIKSALQLRNEETITAA